MADYFGNLSHPNTLSYNVLKNLQDRSQKPSIIRAGGTSADRTIYNASQEAQVINTFGSNSDVPNHVYVGPSWYEAFQTFPDGVKAIYDVNYRDNSTQGVANTIADVQRAWTQLEPVLYAFELGNEAEGWADSGRPTNWSPEVYVPDYLNYTDLIEEKVWKDETASVEPFFQGGVFQGSGGPFINEPWNSVRVLELGLNKEHQIKSMSQHDYHGSNCGDGDPVPELRANLLNHTNVVERVWPHWYMSPIVETYGVDYVLGETNSISCAGADNVSNVFGSALWYLDYNLYVAMNTSVARMYFHQGTMFRYSLWAPYVGAANNSALIRPTYYSALMLAEAIGTGSGKKTVQVLKQEETFVAYSLHENGIADSVIVVNMQPYNATSNTTRPFMNVDLTGSTPSKPGKVFRLTAPGSDVKDGMTWAGQTVSDEGLIEGDRESEEYVPGKPIKLHDSEAILVKFS